MADLLTVRGLTLTFGGLCALDGVDLSIAAGSIAGLIGPNGAGKTSLLNCIFRFYRPQRGEIRLGDVDLLRRPASALAGLGLARTFQHMELFGSMTVLEHVLAGAHTGERPHMLGEALALPAARRAEERMRRVGMALLDLLGLASLAETPVHALPLGLQKRCGIARALACKPRLLLLDEPAGGLNATEKRALGALLRALQRDLNLTVLLIEHDMDLVMSLCETITVLDFGKRIAHGPPAAIQRDPAVISAYLGAGVAAPDAHMNPQTNDKTAVPVITGIDVAPSFGVSQSSRLPGVPSPRADQAPREAAWSPVAAAPTALLQVRGLRVVYGAVPAVQDLSLTVAPGQAVVMLGANGAGKTSTLRAIAGLQRPSAGEVSFDGAQVTGWRTERLARLGLAMVTDTRDLFPRFSVAENLRMGALSSSSRQLAAARDEVLDLFPALGRLLHRPAWTLSGGEQQMLALGRALIVRPRLLLLDEPSLGLAPQVVESIFAALAQIVTAGMAVLLVEQTTAAPLRLATYAYVLRTGRVALAGPSVDLLHDPRVLDLYLGAGDAMVPNT